MPYVSHDRLQEPADDAVLWRYMDFTKFVALLQSSTLYFCPVDFLDDPFEGHLTKPGAELLRNGRESDEADKLLAAIGDMRRLLHVNCWHVSEYESAAMWSLYLKSADGIAIRTTFSSFKKAIACQGEVHGGMVQYIDFDSCDMDVTNAVTLASLKRRSFQHENEFRGIAFGANPRYPHGFDVPVGLHTLIEEVYVAPTSPLWVACLVDRVMNRYGVNKDVRPSRLYEQPNYVRRITPKPLP